MSRAVVLAGLLLGLLLAHPQLAVHAATGLAPAGRWLLAQPAAWAFAAGATAWPRVIRRLHSLRSSR